MTSFYRMNTRKIKTKYWIVIVVIVIILCEYFGVFKFFQQSSYKSDFSYPYAGDVGPLVARLKSGDKPSLPPLYGHDYFMYHNSNTRCLSSDQSHYEKMRLLYLVKSAAGNRDRREAIRRTWGFENRFSDVPIRTVFLLGHVPDNVRLQADIENEQKEHEDIVQGNFVDTYFNNSIKTAMGLRWAVEHCSKSRFFMFVDDDYYVSTRNLLRFLRNPVDYPGYLKEDVISFDEEEQRSRLQSRKLSQLVDFDLPDDVRLWAGFVFDRSRPHRHRSSKWFVDLDEYPFDFWPPYVTAGAYVLSREALVDMYFTSFYTEKFRFDDIWLGLIAHKAGLDPFHSSEFHFHPQPYNVHDYKYTVASHGYSDPKELVRVWSQQKQAGNA